MNQYFATAKIKCYDSFDGQFHFKTNKRVIEAKNKDEAQEIYLDFLSDLWDIPRNPLDADAIINLRKGRFVNQPI